MELLLQARNQLRVRFGKDKQPLIREDSDGAKAFRYSPLRHSPRSKEFRLLKLLPAQELEAEIQCELLHSSLDKHPPYEALSYAWGDPQVTMPISLHGMPHRMTTNLHLALQYMRLQDKERIMWVDALCINQVDTAEKNHQVRQMRDVYLGAQRVVVWLGEERDTLMAMDFCKKLPPVGSGRVASGIAPDQAQRDACNDLFFERPYWKRTWVVQELYHGNSVMFQAGRVCIDVDIFYEMAMRYQSSSSMKDWRRDRVYALLTLQTERSPILAALGPRARSEFGARTKTKPASVFQLLELLQKFRGQEAGDSRDKVFALLGMTTKKCGLEADYYLSRREVYVSTMLQLLSLSWHGLLLVESVNRTISSNHEFPSWVPDFSDPQQVVPQFIWRCHWSFDAGTFNHKGVKGAVPALIRTSPGILTINGVFAATVTGVYRTKIPNDIHGKNFSVTLVRFDQNPDHRRREVKPHYDPWPSKEPREPEVSILNTSWSPERTEIGDIIIVAADCSVPIVLRKHGDAYLFVGMCLLIESQILTKMQGTDLSSTIFKIDAGFSDIMRGSIWDEVGYTRHLEKFHIH